MMNNICQIDGVHILIGNTEFRFAFNYSLASPEINEGEKTVAHDHSYIEMHLVLDGILHIITDNDYYVKKNEILLISPCVYHGTGITKVKTMRYAIRIEFFKKDKIHDNTYPYFKSLFDCVESCIKLSRCHKLIALLRDICSLLKSNIPFIMHRVRSILTIFLLDLCEKMRAQYKNQEFAYFNRIENGLDEEDRLHLDLDSIVSTNSLFGFKKLSEVSQNLYLGKKQINSLMKKRYNMTFKQKQILSRIEYSKKLLLQTDKSIDSIAFEIGYTNLTSFYNNFKKLVGRTPNQYRKESKSNS